MLCVLLLVYSFLLIDLEERGEHDNNYGWHPLYQQQHRCFCLSCYELPVDRIVFGFTLELLEWGAMNQSLLDDGNNNQHTHNKITRALI